MRGSRSIFVLTLLILEACGNSGPPASGSRSGPGDRYLSSVEINGLTTHRSGSNPGGIGYGFGAALFDMDGDNDLDIFLGAQGVDGDLPIIYENKSTNGSIKLNPMRRTQFGRGEYLFGQGIDLGNDGTDELVLFGPEKITLISFGSTIEKTDLLDLLPNSDARRQCTASSAIPFDINKDGLIDLVVGCAASFEADMELDKSDQTPDLRRWANIAYVQNISGELVLLEAQPFENLINDGSTLALAVLDINNNGLLDLVMANDTFSHEKKRNLFLKPGGTFFSCPPRERCTYRERPFAQDAKAYGSFMGLANLKLVGFGERIYVTNLGNNLLLEYQNGVATDSSHAHALEAGKDGDIPLYSWGALVEDLDFDGKDDLLITQGKVSQLETTDDSHHNLVFFQQSAGQFEQSTLSKQNADFSYRGITKVDFDNDGHMEFVLMGLEGSPQVIGEQSNPEDRRCILIPRPRYVPSHGTGFGLSKSSTGPFNNKDIGGQIRLGHGRHIYTSIQKGHIRFPSGAVLPFNCEKSTRPMDISEPKWISIHLEGDDMQIILNTPWLNQPPELAVYLRSHARADKTLFQTSSSSENGYSFNIDRSIDHSFMLSVNGKWIGRWFDIPN